MKYLLFIVLIAASCQNEKPYLYGIPAGDTLNLSYRLDYTSKADTVYIHDTIYKPAVKYINKRKHITDAIPNIGASWEGVIVSPTTTPELSNDYFDRSWEVVKKASTIEINDSLGGGTYSVTEVGDIQDENVELNYSLDNKIQIGWDGKRWVMCGMDGWGDCSIHLYHKSLREILDSANHK